MTLCADTLGTMCRRASHHARTRSASCADTLRIMCRCAPHDVPMRSARCADVLGTMSGCDGAFISSFSACE
ncbi:MAG: hypothetical protein K2G76_00675 [Prevotella sp.]|nr:hypothetical protein [Prevotella sp.]